MFHEYTNLGIEEKIFEKRVVVVSLCVCAHANIKGVCSPKRGIP